jgi:chromosomal replication initiation ATPase DnaA
VQALQARSPLQTRKQFDDSRLQEPKVWRPRGRREEEVIELCESMIDVTAALFNVSSKEMRRTGRTAIDVSRVRQIAMYVTHVMLGLSMMEVGKGFQRDRTTVLHACHLIEDMRDDGEFDRIVGMTERVAVAAFRNREAA